MADYIYLLENRISPSQRAALRVVRDVARANNLTIFLVGGAVRDLTSGSPVRDLDVVVQGNALLLKHELEQAGAIITGEFSEAQTLYAAFPGSTRMEIASTLSVTWPTPGKPVFQSATILEDLRRRDFTANAMALSLNEGSYGLLMDPLNGIADIENRELRLVSNYGFIEDPSRMVRAARYMARLGWSLDEKTQLRYETGKAENYIAALSEHQLGYELEEIIHEEDPLRVLNRLEAEGWLQILAPYWNSSKVDVPALEHLREVQTQLQMQGIQPDPSAANFPLLTAKLNAKDLDTLKSNFVRQGFVTEIDSLEQKAKELASLLTSKAAALPSQTWKIITSAAPEAVLWVAYSSKSTAIQAKFKNFFTVWPQAKQKLPYALMQEMRIVPELPAYAELLDKLFFQLMDDLLQTPDEMRAFLEPYSPPAPPPPVNMRRPRGAKKDAKGKGRVKKAAVIDLDDENEDDGDGELPDEIDEVLSEALDETAENGAVASESEEDEGEPDAAPPASSLETSSAAETSEKAPYRTTSKRKTAPPSAAEIVPAEVRPSTKIGAAKASAEKNLQAKPTVVKGSASKALAQSKSETSKASAGKVNSKSTEPAARRAAEPAKASKSAAPSSGAKKTAVKVPAKPAAKPAAASKNVAKKVAAPTKPSSKAVKASPAASVKAAAKKSSSPEKSASKKTSPAKR